MFLNGKNLFPLIILLWSWRISNGTILEPDILEPCENKDSCSKFDSSPKKCRAAKCNFQCDTKVCGPVDKCHRLSNSSDVSDVCAHLCYDRCNCRRSPYCEYDVAGGNCFQIFPQQGIECHERMFEEWQCVQEGKFYIESGVPCRAVTSSGICDFVEQILAVNLNGENYTDARNVWYRSEMDVKYLDEYNTRVPGTFQGSFEGPDEELYSTFIQGSKPETLTGRCINYVVDLTFAGHYELSVRMAEFFKTGAGQRYFTVKLNEQPILEDFDLYKVVGAANQPADFVLTFVVNPDGWMHLKGLPCVKLIQGRVTLSFCYGGCDMIPDYGYIVSAFHILRIRSLLRPEPPISPPDPPSGPSGSTETPAGNPSCPPEESGRPETAFNETICLYPGGACSIDSDDYYRKHFENCTLPPPHPGNDTSCRLYDGNLCSCKKEGCEYNVETNTCRWGETVCAELPEIEADCKKEGTFAAYGGLICLSTKTTGNCNVEKSVSAVNLNGPDTTDMDGVKYEQDKDSLYLDPFGIRATEMGVSCKDNASIMGVQPEEETIYTNIIFGNPKVKTVRDSLCVIYQTNITEPGRYLLTIKTADLFVEKINTRFFTIKIHQISILPNLDLVRLAGPCTAAEFLVNFNVSSDNMLTLRGHSPARMTNNLLCIQFCFSACDVPQRNFISSGFSIVMLEPAQDVLVEDGSTTTTTPATIITTTPTSSTIEPTEEDDNNLLTTLGPVAPSPQPNCKSLTDVVECKRLGCEWQLTEGTCIPAPKKCIIRRSRRLTNCRRGEAFYVENGVLCRSHNGGDIGDCNIKSVVLAVNLNGPSYPDHSKILHVEDSADLYMDQHNTRQPMNVSSWKRMNCKGGLVGAPSDDDKLYSTLVFGKNAKRAQGRCLSYHIDITKDARFEFVFRTVETYYTNDVSPGRKPRQFNVRLNGKVIIPELNILHKVEPCEVLKIVTEFAVQSGDLVPLGFQSGSQVSKSGRVDLEFCYGDGVDNPAIDPNYIGASFYIIELSSSNIVIPTTTPSPMSPTSPTSISSSSTSSSKAPTGKPTKKTTARTTKQSTGPTPTTPSSIISTTPPVVPPVTGVTPNVSRCGDDIKPTANSLEALCTCIKGDCDASYAIYQTDPKWDFGCIHRVKDCADLDYKYKESLFPMYHTTACRRAGGAYSVGGSICIADQKSSEDIRCPVRSTPLAIRFHGSEPYTDARNITYTPMSVRKPDKSDYPYELEYRQLSEKQEDATENAICHTDDSPRNSYMNVDHELWHYYVVGKSSSPRNACFKYLVDLPADGTYELIVKTAEYELKEGERRAFNIKLNGLPVFPEVDILNIHGAPCHATDLVVKFDVGADRSKMQIRGFNPEIYGDHIITYKQVPIEFCRGHRECSSVKKQRNIEFTGVAFAVNELDPTYEGDKP